MGEKHYLFYEKKTFKEKWQALTLAERITYALLILAGILFAFIGILLTALSTWNIIADLFIATVFCGFVPASFWLSVCVMKSYYVIFDEECVHRNGSYINALGEDNNVLFTVRTSKQIEEILQQKCKDATWIDIETYINQHYPKYTISEKEKQVIDQYKGMV